MLLASTETFLLSLLAHWVAGTSVVRQQQLSPRPNVTAAPYSPAIPHASSPARTKVCSVQAYGNGQDDSQTLLSAARECNNGGTVALLGEQYIIGKPLDLTFLDAIDFDIQGKISFTSDISYWLENSFQYAFQESSSYWQWGGSDVNIYGGGIIDGSGQVWWDAFAANSSLARPLLFAMVGMQHATMNNLHMMNPPNWFNFISNSPDVIVSDMLLTVASNSSNAVKNSDGWDTYRSDSIVIQDSIINNTDDCVSFKPNSTNIVVQNLSCTGSHGISVGSLGQYLGEMDIVENIYVYNASMTDCSDSARIKVYQGAIPDANGSIPTSSGGGSGYVRNVTYDGMHDTNDNYAIELTQCYGEKNVTICNQYPSLMLIEDIVFKNFDGTSSAKYDPIVGTLVCSSTSACSNIVANNITITNPSGKAAQWTCQNIDDSLLEINCVS